MGYRKCCVDKCSSTEKKGISIFRVPSITTHADEPTRKIIPKQREAWLSAIKLGPGYGKQKILYVCGLHFVKGTLNFSVMKCVTIELMNFYKGRPSICFGTGLQHFIFPTTSHHQSLLKKSCSLPNNIMMIKVNTISQTFNFWSLIYHPFLLKQAHH